MLEQVTRNRHDRRAGSDGRVRAEDAAYQRRVAEWKKATDD